MSIRILPVEIASQIAAGEVVERPASVVKELLENALDAGANHVSIRVKGAGKQLIEVADNGAGISAKELPLAVTRHATSKISKAEDLFKIRTLGFRGEALASIGSVSRMSITSCPSGSATGARIHVEGGIPGEMEVVGVPEGTKVRVENLFYNVPARLKFLKKDVTERRHIDALVTRYALSYPEVRMSLEQESKISLQTSGNGNSREVLVAVYGTDTARQMIEVVSKYDDFQLHGFTSPPSLTRTNRREITFFVNGRWVQDSALTAALIQAYHTLLMVGRFPRAILFLRIPPDAVDVNVHPTKAEVRFRERDRIFSDVQRSVRRALLAHTPVTGINTQMKWSGPQRWETSGRQIDPAWDMSRDLDKTARGSDLGIESDPESDMPPPQQELPTGRVPLLLLIGQVARSYLIAEGPDGLYLIDQHAAHERVLFEKYMSLRGGTIPSQALMEPVTAEFPPHHSRLIEDQMAILESLGFRVEYFGRNSFLIRALPAILAGLEPRAALQVLVEDFEEDETPLESEIEAKIIGRVCKRAAVKAGQTLSPEEQQRLIRDLEACISPRTCPHGRPTMIHLSVDLLERQFGRKGAR